MDFPSQFILDESFSHLNAGTRTRVPLSVIEFMERERRDGERNPTKAMFTGYDRIWEVQKRVAQFLGTTGEKIFLRNNVTAAFNDFLFALPKLGSGEVLSTGWEYGGTVGLAKHWAKQVGLQFRLHPLELRHDWTESALRDAVLASLRPDTKVLLVSHVSTGNGAILPVKEIASAARERGVITVIDGAHAIGAIPVHLDSLEGADFYGGNFHKWFLGPEGTGFGWVHPRWNGKLEWKFGGWASEAPPSFYQGFGDQDPETCRRFFPGTIDRIPFLGLGMSLSFWEKHGAEKIRAAQTRLRDLVASEAEALGWKRRSPRNPDLLGPLVAFSRPEEWGEAESASLATRIYLEANVQLALPVVQGEALVRFSPGIYAREHEVRQGISRLAAWRA
jgi:isopenicillin-N epimerase